MSVRAYFDVFCDRCSQILLGGDTGAMTVAQARAAAKQRGWARKANRITGKLEDACPRCLKKAE